MVVIVFSVLKIHTLSKTTHPLKIPFFDWLKKGTPLRNKNKKNKVKVSSSFKKVKFRPPVFIKKSPP
jgi:hypothetical protein